MSGNLHQLSQSDLDGLLTGSDGMSLSQTMGILPASQDFLPSSQDLLGESFSPILNAWQSDNEDLQQTGPIVEHNNFPGEYNFDVQIEESTSKNYVFSEKLNRLYINMDKVVPIKFNWNGPTILHVRGMVMFKEPDYVKIPVYRCRTHNDENYANNKDVTYFKHVLRCDNEHSLYKENKVSHRHSVVTLFNSQTGVDGVKGLYRFMCFTTCNGVDAISRRSTNLVLTLEDSNCRVHGRVVIEVKICTSPLRDKKRDEDDDGRKKRKSNDGEQEKRYLKKERNQFSDTVVKREVNAEDGYVDLQVNIPNFPANKEEEFRSMLVRLVASFYASDTDVASVTRNVQIHKF